MQKSVSDFINKYNLHSDEQTGYIDLVSEIGELGKEILKSTNYGKQDFSETPEQLLEMGDCLFSIFALCHKMNIDSEQALRKALSKYEARFGQKGDIGSGV